MCVTFVIFKRSQHTLFLRLHPSILSTAITITTRLHQYGLRNIWINSVLNAGMKSVIVLGCTLHYYSTTQTQVHTCKHIILEYLEDFSHSKCESSEITQACFARES